MVQVPKKLHAVPSRKGTPQDAPVAATLHREPSSRKVPMQLRVKAEVAREFRVFCAAHDLQLSEAFELMFIAYRK